MSVNKVLLLGRLGADPEFKYTQNQTPICNFRMATNERRKGADGQWADATEWHRVITFGKTAENCNQFLKKGSQVFIDGKIRTNKWQDQEGKDRYTTEIIANEVKFIGSRSDGIEVERTGNYNTTSSSTMAPAGATPVGESVSFDDDDIPF